MKRLGIVLVVSLLACEMVFAEPPTDGEYGLNSENAPIEITQVNFDRTYGKNGWFDLTILYRLTNPAEEWPNYLEFGVVIYNCWGERIRTSRALERFLDTRDNKKPETSGRVAYQFYLGNDYGTGAVVWLRRARLWDESGTIWIYNPERIITAAEAVGLHLDADVLEIEDPEVNER